MMLDSGCWMLDQLKEHPVVDNFVRFDAFLSSIQYPESRIATEWRKFW
jgi:hypothetical protein